MGSSQQSLRVMHYIGEFLDLDAKSFTSIAEFIALIQAIREGLSRINSNFMVSDFQLNILFLSKLQAHPKWNEWARQMLRDPRVNVSDSSKTMAFHTLAELAIQREKEMMEAQTRQQEGNNQKAQSQTSNNGRLQNFTQEEINSFVVRQMRDNPDQPSTRKLKGHSKRPSQEEINEFVIHQMRKERERQTRSRSKSEPKPNGPSTIPASRPTTSADFDRCDKCGGKNHPGLKCHSQLKPVAEIPKANFTPKKVEFRTQTAGGFPMYHTRFALT